MSRHGSGGGYEKILAVVRAAKGRIRQSEILTGIGWTVLSAGLAILLLVVLDNLLYLPSLARILLLVAAVAAVGVVVHRTVVRVARRRLTDDSVAVRIESAAATEDNALINALQLGREREQDGLSGAIIRSVVERGATTANRFSPGRVVNRKGVARALGAACVAVLLVVAYAVFFADHFANAMERYVRPTAFIPPVSSTELVVRMEPADGRVYEGDPLRVSVRARDGILSSARIHVRRDGDFEPSEMLFDGREFSFVFERVEVEFDFRVEAADAWSKVYRVTLRELPAVENLSLTYRYPRYLQKEDLEDPSSTGDIRAPVGTSVLVTATLTQPVRDATLRLKDDYSRMELVDERTVRGELVVRAPDVWSLAFETLSGTGNPSPVRHRVVPIPDEPPEVSITVPGKDLTITLPARVTLTALARDDHGLGGEIHLVIQKGELSDAAVVGRWPVNGEKERVVTYAFHLDKGDLKPGDVLTYYAVARDRYPAPEEGYDLPPRQLESRSRVFTITVKSPGDRAAEGEAALADLATRLRELLEREEAVLRDTSSLLSGVASRSTSLTSLKARAEPLAVSQSRIGSDMEALGRSVPGDIRALAGIRGALLSMAANESTAIVRNLRDSPGRGAASAAAADLTAAEKSEKKIITRLKMLLGQVETLLKRAEENGEGWVDEKMDEADPEAALKDAIARLKKFIREQEDILEQTRKFENKDVDDFTEEDLAQLEKLAAAESELSRFLEDLKDDLSKIPDQDFSNSTILKELIEAYSEVELAADALTRKSVELAVPREQSGLELAESLTENIEKWLPDVRDNIKWKMEEFDGEYPDVPMADLPDQLEDLMGDLLEDEEQLGEDADDVTSGWADSIDKGAGWGVSDGPISNMSAQGKTGNTLPNNSEIGGRSGEGRSGRSHGEMVEGEATGKGGRRTPTRLTPDPWEGKSVKDSSTDPLGGATGGGKLSGGGPQGLRGPMPPAVKGELGRLAGNQVAIRQRAERLDRMLKGLHYPSEDVSRSIVLMKELEEALAKGDIQGFSRRHGVLVQQMKGGQAAVLDHTRVVKDRSQAVPKEVLREVESVDLTDLPEGYRELLREYYKILSRGGSR